MASSCALLKTSRALQATAPRYLRPRASAPYSRLPPVSSSPTPTLYPCSPSTTHPHARLFTHKSSLLVLARPIPRPQLPFLHPSPTLHLPLALPRTNILTSTLTRYISTERKKRWKEQFWSQVRFHSYFWPAVTLVLVLYAGLKHVKLEREFPTPHEWPFWTRWAFRMARFTAVDDGSGNGVTAAASAAGRGLVDWRRVGAYWEDVLRRLEGDDGTGSVGDVSGKSEQWRRGYHEALMGAAGAAENLQGLYRRKADRGGWLKGGEGRLYPLDSIVSAENPRPKPLPWDKKYGHEAPPTWSEVEPAFESPEVFYNKILNMKGFDNRQRMDAALAYADWLDFVGGVYGNGGERNPTAATAESQYKRGLELACEGLSEASKQKVVDVNTGIINKGYEESVTENILKASTALGVHYARSGRVKDALPVFLSVLRARKSLPPSPLGATGEEKKVQYRDDGGIEAYLSALKDLVIERPYPPPPPTGNERPFHTLKEACEEVGLMTYIGEILFATSTSEREKGLSWTRDSIEAAEAIMWVMDEQKVDDGREKCRQCLETGLQNWREMAQQMARLAAKKESDLQNASSGVFGFGKASQLAQAQQDRVRWEDEKEVIELRRQKTLPLTQPLKPVRGGWEARI